MTEVKKLINAHVPLGCVSDVLLQQLVRHYDQSGEKYYDTKIERTVTKNYDIAVILETLKSIISGGTKRDKFKYAPLKGLFKAVHVQASSLQQDIEKGIKPVGLSDFEKAIASGGFLSEKDCLNLENMATVGALKNQKQYRGDWIIYYRHAGKLLFLCLATYEEGDDSIFKRVKHLL